MERCYAVWKRICHRIAHSTLLSVVTTLLTVYALFGDDIRLLATEKQADWIFDYLCIVSLSVFSLEVTFSSFGKNGYFFSFFFWLDIVSTITLFLEISSIAEDVFGDSISKAQASGDSSGSNAVNSDAARAARMSRVGSKASRVVRLVRLVWLLRLLRVYFARRHGETSGHGISPGYDFDEDESDVLESAVSKKLSEMTTRRVIMLVMAILIAVPLFDPSMYTDALPSSAQYGINELYGLWQDGIGQYQPNQGAAQRQQYLDSDLRVQYLELFYMYAFYHNPFCDQATMPSTPTDLITPQGSDAQLFWVGMGPPASSHSDLFLPITASLPKGDPNVYLNRPGQTFYYCNLTADPLALFNMPWNQTASCVADTVRGLSLVRGRESSLVCPENLRFNERVVVFSSVPASNDPQQPFFMFVFDRRMGSQFEALLNILRTVFICFLLGFGAMTFSNDSNMLVLQPIERMIARINKIRTDPLSTIRLSDEEQSKAAAKRRHRHGVRLENDISSDEVRAEQRKQRNLVRRCWVRAVRWGRSLWHQEVPEPMETVVLEKTVIKIGSLLALGFGEAGSEIIVQSMKGDLSTTLNAMKPGRSVESIFCFCAIRNFTQTTEVLKDQVTVFVNRIAHVVHSCSSEYCGSPNKNMGEAFLLTWRLSGHSQDKQQLMADMALMATVKIVAQICKSPLLAEYRHNPALNRRMANYRVAMGFGLHCGPAIEGAIGSEFKVDALYLGHSVSLSARLEGMTKQYGSVALFSEAVVQRMSVQLRQECRLIDHVLVEGALPEKPFRLYTIDLNERTLEVERARFSMNRQTRWKHRVEVKRMMVDQWDSDYKLHDAFTSDPDICAMRRSFQVEFLCRFHMAYLNYEAGQWAVASQLLKDLSEEDGPSLALLKFVRHYKCEAPEGWPGYRILVKKAGYHESYCI